MRIVIAPDSFKGSLSAIEAANAMAAGVLQVWPQAELTLCPIADGGEGTVAALVQAAHGSLVSETVTGPLGQAVTATWGFIHGGRTAVIEMAQASGLTLVPPQQRNPLVTTTYGTGELIKRALDRGCRRFIIGIGGSATNDGGAGMAHALGVSLRDASGRELPFGGAALAGLTEIDISGLDPRVKEAEFVVACDVDNPMVGPQGASAVYGPQKGATPAMVAELDAALAIYAEKMAAVLGVAVANMPGAGAAGGLGGGLVAFLGARLERGIQVVSAAVGLEEIIRQADLVITGEGQVDGQTLCGKAVHGVVEIAHRYGIPAIVLGGAVRPSADALCEAFGSVSVLSIVNEPMSLEHAMANAASLLQSATARGLRLIKTGMVLGQDAAQLFPKRK